MSTFENKIFKFKYRMYQDSPDTHYIRENRMILRYLDRLKNRPDVAEVDQAKVLELYENEGAQSAYLYAKPYRDWVMDEAIQQYCDYYESDDEDVAEFKYITPIEKSRFAKIFKDYSRPMNDIQQVT
jgi:hypothetical protein